MNTVKKKIQLQIWPLSLLKSSQDECGHSVLDNMNSFDKILISKEKFGGIIV